MKKLENIKEILSKYSPEYNENDWLELEKKLPKPKSSILKKTIISSFSGLIIISSIIAGYYIINNNNKQSFISQNIPINNIISGNNKNNINVVSETSSNNIENKKIISTNNNNNSTLFSNNTINNNNISIKENVSNVNSQQIQNNVEIKSTQITNEDKTENNNPEKFTKSNITEPNIDNIIFKIEQTENCTPAKVVFSASNVPENCKIYWNTDDNKKISGSKVEYIYNKQGTFEPTVAVSVNNFVIKTENLPTIILNSPEIAKIEYTNSKNNYLFAIENANATEIEWTINNDRFYDNNIEYYFEKEGKYNIYLKITNKWGCVSTAKENIIIRNEQVFYLPTAFIANSDGINSMFGPIGENLDFQQFTFNISDMQGNKIFSTRNINEQWNGKINNDGADVVAGVYFWEIKTVDFSNKATTKKGKVNLFRQ
ncbi:MAG: gliding motility-associated C-terminal domain-containing protein [Bacteroidales bacterium]|jgi:hypothetical protein|nr:gliding motility-associated C-terminal domain-containing protein [Bacteroidales bacterium]